MNQHPTLSALFVLAVMLTTTPVRAQDSFYEDHPDRGLRFADMEFAMPTDPLLPSWVSFSHVIHTPSRYLDDATAKLRAAIPVGSEASAAAGILAKAGARCRQPGPDVLTCGYRDVETPWGGEYWDSVSWTVTMPLVAGRVADLTVARDWTRR